VGFSEGGASADPGSMDISASLPASYAAATFAVQPLQFDAAAPQLGTTIPLTTSNVPAASQFGAVIMGLTNVAVDLSTIGMAGCTRYTDALASVLWLPAGYSVSVPFTIPANPAFTGVVLVAQSVAYAPAAGLTLLGAISSNGVTLTLGQ
jgi:hypothetical protein